MATLPTGYPYFSLGIYLGVLLDTFPMCWLTYCVVPDASRRVRWFSTLRFLSVMEFLGTLLWDLMIRFDERCFSGDGILLDFWFEILGGVEVGWNHQPYSVLHYLDPACLLSLGPQQLAWHSGGRRRLGSNDRSSECVWGSQCSGLRMGDDTTGELPATWVVQSHARLSKSSIAS